MAGQQPFPVSTGAKLLREEPLAPLTSFLIGGPAELLLLPAETGDIVTALQYAREEGMPWRIIGSGTNILVPDKGLPGLTIKFWRQFSSIYIDGTELTAQAGATTWEVSRVAAEAGLSGVEFVCGIPGTVGGAVFMNAGVKELEIRNVLLTATILERDGSVAARSPEELGLSYRSSALQDDGGTVMDARFSLRKGAPEEILIEMNRFLAERRAVQPINQPNCGSVFRNPPGDFAGRLIEAAGCKRMQVGGVAVSEQHANFLVNLGGGTSSDVLELLERIKERVERRSGMRLELEMRIVE